MICFFLYNVEKSHGRIHINTVLKLFICLMALENVYSIIYYFVFVSLRKYYVA